MVPYMVCAKPRLNLANDRSCARQILDSRPSQGARNHPQLRNLLQWDKIPGGGGRVKDSSGANVRKGPEGRVYSP